MTWRERIRRLLACWSNVCWRCEGWIGKDDPGRGTGQHASICPWPEPPRSEGKR
jgi:hypothetical protein